MYDEEDEFVFVVRQEHLNKIAEMRPLLFSLARNVKIFAIDDWKKCGSVYDIMRIADRMIKARYKEECIWIFIRKIKQNGILR